MISRKRGSTSLFLFRNEEIAKIWYNICSYIIDLLVNGEKGGERCVNCTKFY